MVETRTEPSSLALKDGLELSLLAGANVDKHWSQFYVFLFGLIAWLASNISSIAYRDAFIITVAATAFFLLNAIATIRAYWILNLIIEETTNIARQSIFASDYVNNIVKIKRLRVLLPLRIPIAVLGHAVAAIAVAYLAWRNV